MIGKKVVSFKSIDSTNTYLKENQENFVDGTVVVSKIQEKGRGRGDRVWESTNGNLYLSFILKENISYGRIFNILSRVCVSVINLLGKYEIEAKIKYPNDILVKNRKISGILIETYGNLVLEGIIVGIGINVNQIDFGTLNHKATSINNEINREIDVEAFQSEFVETYNKTLIVDDMSIFDEYLKHSMVLGKGIDYQGTNYKINTISPSGELLLTGEVETKRVSLNEISLEELYDE